MTQDSRYDPQHPQHRELLLACCANGDHDRVAASAAKQGDLVDPATLPDRIVAVGGGWVAGRYFTTGAHKDGKSGWRCTQVGGQIVG